MVLSLHQISYIAAMFVYLGFSLCWKSDEDHIKQID